ncbi:DUF1642 domain-containing protein [Streptococcus sp. BJSWXB6CM1]|uniref:DUF1642 domain-containing protein n=1 Tax=Streptococcus fermentans TaxID=3095082 RepID=A0ABU5FXT6_9STRE|nr:MULTISPECIES: DUF1642 domain-containing protein [unclassified Streptococcus]MDY4346557.1 DUF1642 domain-containing protein [Streptococcus sp. BJSWXB5TM5]MDY4360873.1 DUF1642 domain-containing protein [Streptococcus sp. BJSWXB3CM3]MDY4371153.1 DUF1642 domain-containing protein [Streptococcus sp. BJSWXB6CM1]
MKVQRLIEKYKGLEGIWDAEGAELARQIFLQDLQQLDEPQPVKVPQFVAEYIEFKKKNNFHVYGAMRVIEDHYDKRVPEWFYEGNIEKFCLAWIFGYEVEEEKRYLVKVKGVNGYGCYLNKGLLSKEYFFESKNEIGGCRTKHTRKQLEDDDFGWVFDCEGIEIKEVEK